MSAGHHHGHKHDPALEREVTRLLLRRDIKAYLARSFKVSSAYHIPFTGGSSVDGRTYYIDPNVSPEDRPFVLWHERTEKAFRDVLKMGYLRAHLLATAAERMKILAAKKDWEAYKRDIGKTVRLDEKERPTKLPPDLDLGPYRESGMMDLLSKAMATKATA